VKQKPFESETSLSELDDQALATAIISDGPLRRTTRGVEVHTGPTLLYSPNSSDWPQTGDGTPIPQVCWGGTMQPLHRSNLGYLIAGVPGTGKTLSVRLLLQSFLDPRCKPSMPGNDRAGVYDPKQEFYPILRGMGVAAHRICLLNPFYLRGVAWDIADDYTTPRRLTNSPRR
jgi:hypothetical protein